MPLHWKKVARQAALMLPLAFCVAIGSYGVIYVAFTFGRLPIIGYKFHVLFPDFLVFHAAACAFFEGLQGQIYDVDAMSKLQQVFYPDLWPPSAQIFRPFFYPPTWLLMVLPFCFVAAGPAYGLFMLLTVAIATALEGRHEGWAWLAVVVSPAAVWAIVAGQASFLAIGLLYGGLRLLDRSPAVAGGLLGVLSYKPHLWVLVPIALLAARKWMALIWTVGTAAALAVASAAVFGVHFWMAFIELAREMSSTSSAISETLFRGATDYLTSVFAAGRVLGLSANAAMAMHVCIAALAIIAVAVAFYRYPASDARTAVLATATLLLSPYVLVYDLLLVVPAVVALYRWETFPRRQVFDSAVLAAVWLLPLFSVKLHRNGLPIAPIIVLLFGVVAWRHMTARDTTTSGSKGPTGP